MVTLIITCIFLTLSITGIALYMRDLRWKSFRALRESKRTNLQMQKTLTEVSRVNNVLAVQVATLDQEMAKLKTEMAQQRMAMGPKR